MSDLSFRHLNLDWNAEPNAPEIRLTVEGDTVQLTFLLNPWAYDAGMGEKGILRFIGCSRWRWDSTNDHAWFAGEGLYSKHAPEWGEFYEVIGDSRPVGDDDWEVLSPDRPKSRQFLFYFRDETIEFFAEDWVFNRSTG
ncbi:hypothetical protein [Mesorhizobium sp. ES1-3]|uniref:hypothetical protein n=1 Tax=Mesorhizobium sp. ES1-3 TaxID=2876628 RepID=UPI001CCCE451|nr:hypothetical protein [Mesorhizobium sp. ES1-3]MBZ9669172.1 hypothetical protein [Mesorhizobium sp. ES1-3]